LVVSAAHTLCEISDGQRALPGTVKHCASNASTIAGIDMGQARPHDASEIVHRLQAQPMQAPDLSYPLTQVWPHWPQLVTVQVAAQAVVLVIVHRLQVRPRQVPLLSYPPVQVSPHRLQLCTVHVLAPPVAEAVSKFGAGLANALAWNAAIASITSNIDATAR
jgi:hypothetical protein